MYWYALEENGLCEQGLRQQICVFCSCTHLRWGVTTVAAQVDSVAAHGLLHAEQLQLVAARQVPVRLCDDDGRCGGYPVMIHNLDTECTRHSFCCLPLSVSPPSLLFLSLSQPPLPLHLPTVSVAEKAQQLPHWPWFLTGVMQPLVRQSTFLGSTSGGVGAEKAGRSVERGL